jgi:hypothetical protein
MSCPEIAGTYESSELIELPVTHNMSLSGEVQYRTFESTLRGKISTFSWLTDNVGPRTKYLAQRGG